MPWVKLDDHFSDHPKVASLDDAAFRLHVSALCYCSRYLTDGEIPRGVVPRIAASETPFETADALVGAGVWIRTETGYRIHDYLEYQPSREAALAAKAARSESGRKGAESRWHGKQDGEPMANAIANPIAKAMAKPMANGWQNHAPSPVPDPIPDPQPSTPVPQPPAVEEGKEPPSSTARAASGETASVQTAHEQKPPGGPNIRLDTATTGKKTRCQPTDDDGFDLFWAMYPAFRRNDKNRCQQLWRKNLKDGATADEINSGLRLYLKSDQWKRGVVCNATNFLIGAYWSKPIQWAPMAEDIHADNQRAVEEYYQTKPATRSNP